MEEITIDQCFTCGGLIAPVKLVLNESHSIAEEIRICNACSMEMVSRSRETERKEVGEGKDQVSQPGDQRNLD